ncbi:hypothetical protein IJT93_00065 [bacterium]|nr:hypothetical protein [bacterium]
MRIICLSLLILILSGLLFLCIKLAGGWLHLETSSPFAGLLPENTPFAIEGTPRQITYFLQTYSGLTTGIFNGYSADELKDLRVLVALLPYKNNTSKKCQAFLNQEVCKIEDSWSQNGSYPTQLEPFACPEGGKISYQATENGFTLTCQAETHRTAYSSREGFLPSTVRQSPLYKPTASLQTGGGDFYQTEDERLAELKNNSQAAKSIQNTDISKILHYAEINSPSYSAAADSNISYYQKTIDCYGPRAAQLEKINKPLAHSTIFDPISLEEPLVIAVSGLNKPLQSFTAFEERPGLQFWSPTPDIVKALVSRPSDSDRRALPIQAPNDTDFQLFGKSETFDKLFPQLGLSLPSACSISLRQVKNSASDHPQYTGEIVMPPECAGLYKEMAQQKYDCRKLISNLPPLPAVICSNTVFSDLVIDDRADWTLKTAVKPSVLATAIDTSDVSSIFQLKIKLVQAVAGHFAIDLSAAFTDPKSLQTWHKASPWYANGKTAYSKTDIQENVMTVKAGVLPVLAKAPEIPKGAGQEAACGWITLHRSKKTVTYSFAAGLVPQNEKTPGDYRIWFNINRN